jgi:hypothetical protein
MGHLIKKSILYELAFPSLAQFLFSLPYQTPIHVVSILRLLPAVVHDLCFCDGQWEPRGD